MYKIDEKTWSCALITQVLGTSIACVALIGYIVSKQSVGQLPQPAGRWWTLALLFPPYLVFILALILTLAGRLKDPGNRAKVITVAAYVNTLCLGGIIFYSGGATGIFTPVFLLIPHTTAAFLRETSYEINVYIIGVLTVLIYCLAHFLVPPEQNVTTVYSAFVAGVLAGTVALSTYLAYRVPCKACVRLGCGKTTTDVPAPVTV